MTQNVTIAIDGGQLGTEFHGSGSAGRRGSFGFFAVAAIVIYSNTY